MGFTVEKNNFVSVENLIATLATDLTANGFSLVSVDDQNADLSLVDSHKSILLKPDTTVDPLAGDEDQPWLLYIVADDADDVLAEWFPVHGRVFPSGTGIRTGSRLITILKPVNIT